RHELQDLEKILLRRREVAFRQGGHGAFGDLLRFFGDLVFARFIDVRRRLEAELRPRRRLRRGGKGERDEESASNSQALAHFAAPSSRARSVAARTALRKADRTAPA